VFLVGQLQKTNEKELWRLADSWLLAISGQPYNDVHGWEKDVTAVRAYSSLTLDG
jgi:hypothetical protein